MEAILDDVTAAKAARKEAYTATASVANNHKHYYPNDSYERCPQKPKDHRLRLAAEHYE